MLPEDETSIGPTIIDPALNYDPFSASLRKFSQNLTELHIHSACLTSGTFWPSPNEPHNIPPTWPDMKNFNISFSAMAPDGKWFFTGPVPPSDADMIPFRTYPDAETFDPFFAAFTKAVLNMPTLEYFCLSAADTSLTDAYFQVRYNGREEAIGGSRFGHRLEPGTIEFAYGEKGTWIPDPETMRLLSTLGQSTFGRPLVINHVEGKLYSEGDTSDEPSDSSSDDATDDSTDV